ncbi:MAG: G1 family glutamic endopeptidase [Thermoplasmata archaeon]
MDFLEWEFTNVGVGSYSTSSTTMIPQSGDGALYLETSNPNTGPWAAYVMGYGGSTTTLVNATITLPSSASYIPCAVAYCTTSFVTTGHGTLGGVEVVSFWVGLGQVAPIWQAGVDVVEGYTYDGLGSLIQVIQAWWEVYTGPSSTYTGVSLAMSLGDRVDIEVDAVNSTTTFYYFDDLTNHNTAQGYVQIAAPTNDFAEWVVEDPQTASGAVQMPNWNSASFSYPVVFMSCTGDSCPTVAQSFLAPLYSQELYETDCYQFNTCTNWDLSPGYVTSPYETFSVLT